MDEEKNYNYKIYTPYEFAIKMVKKSLEYYFKEGKSEERLKNLKICDLSCGTGNLLLVALEELLKYSREILGTYVYYPTWLTGYDIDEKALEICEDKIKNLLGKYFINCEEINLNCEDSLYLEEGETYDILLGNPPYLGEKNNKEIFQEIRRTEFGKKYYESKMDYLYFFIEKGIDLLKKGGILTYVTTNYWLKADGANKLRGKFQEEGSFLEIDTFEFSLFKNAVGQHNMIFYWIKNEKINEFNILEEGENFLGYNEEIYNPYGKIVLAPKYIMDLNKSILDKSNFSLGELVNINQGIVTGHDKAYIFNEWTEEFKDYLKPFYKNKDINRYTTETEPPFWILYLDRKIALDEKLENHLEQYREKLSQRREVVTSRINWWELQWARDEEIFLKPKIVVRQRCKNNNFAYNEGIFYGSADIYYMTKKNSMVDLFYILGYLNSKVFFKWFKYNGKIKGKNLEFYSTPLKETPIYYPEKEFDREYISNLVRKQIKNYSEDIQREIDNYFYKIFIE